MTGKRAGLLFFAACAVFWPSTITAQTPCANPAAQIVRIANRVEHKVAAASVFVPATLNLNVCEGDSVRAGERSRATIAFLDRSVVLTIEQNTEWVVRRPTDPRRSLIELIRGAILFFTRQPLDIETPFVNATVEGTEFLVQVLNDRAVITVFEGRVQATNPQGSVTLTSNQSAVAAKGQAPQLQVIVRPRDAVQWALYYQPLLADDSLETLEQIPEGKRDARFYVRRAALLLRVGRLNEARADIKQALNRDPNDGEAYALSAVIAVALNDRAEALTNGQEAIKRSPKSATARVALSYALQANFQLEAAREQVSQAVADQPDDARAWARLAELWLSLGYLDRAQEAAGRASSLAPNVSRASTVLGFAALARVDISEARTAFERAIALESDSPLARLGLGLAKIRRGDLEGGRRDIEIAAALSPDDPIVRSYLGKAYFEEKRDTVAGDQLDMAKQLDPNDPTAWFYDAIRKQTLNRPIEALHDLTRSIELNDNRAVYRSRLLLDEDEAVRGARLGRIYRDLGFEQLALREGWKSLNVAPEDHAAHRLLADNYLVLPRHTIARDSELLQSQLLQPININPVQPRLADNGLVFLDDTVAAIGLNEFARLFAADQLRFVGDALVGEQDTFGDNLILSGIFNRLSFSIGQFHSSTDGVRENHDVSQDIYNGFVQADLTPSTSAQIEFRRTSSDIGDRQLLFDPDNFFSRQRSQGDTSSIRIGARHTFIPGSVLIGSYVHRTLDDDFREPDLALRVVEDQTADFVEVRHLQKWRQVNLTGGVGYYHGDRLQTTFFGSTAFPAALNVHHTNGYFYVSGNLNTALTVIAGLSGDDFDDGRFQRTQTNPKLGVSWTITPTTTIRGAFFRALQRTLIASQTIEPTQVAGFNQFFEDGNGTNSWRSGVAFDKRFGRGLYSGVEFSMRKLEIPVRIRGSVTNRDNEERLIKFYLYSTPTTQVAWGADYQIERLEPDPTKLPPLQAFTESTMHLVGVELRAFLRSGWFLRARPQFVYQKGLFQASPDDPFTMAPADTQFAVLNASVGYRLPNRWGVAALDVQNLFDNSFRFQDSAPRESRILPKRLVTARLTVTF